MALMIMLDGLRADAVETGAMPNLEALRAGKWQPGYQAAWSLTGQLAPGAAPSSAPNHVSIATGFAPSAHGVRANGETANGNYTTYPTWLQRVVDANPGTTALFVYSWAEDGGVGPTADVEFLTGTDAANAASLATRLTAADAPDATLYFIDAIDAAGHASGYYPMSTGYRASLAAVDGYIGACLGAIAARSTFANEDWLITVTSDHGGYSKYHGQITAGRQADTIPLVIAGTTVTQGRIAGSPYNFDVTANTLAHFGVTVSGLQATSRDGVAAAVSRTLNDGLVVYLPFNDTATSNVVAGSSVTPEAVGDPAIAGNGMVGQCLSINTNKVVKLTGSDTGSLAYEDSNRSFTAVIWARYDLSKLVGDPVLFGNKPWSGFAKGALLAARMDKAFNINNKSTYFPGVGFNAGSGLSNQTQGSGRLDFYPFDAEDASVWTFYAVTRSAEGVITVYQGRSDGTLDWSCGTFTGFTLESGYPFYIGQDGTGNYGKHFLGDVDDFALWTRGLSHEEIRRIYESGRSGMELGDLLKIDAHDAPTMDVASAEGVFTLTFGGRRTRFHELYLAYGAADAGENKYAWDSFVQLADIPVSTNSFSYTVPEAFKETGTRLRFFLMQTDDLPYVKEVEYAHSDGTAWINSGIAPRRDMTAEFDTRLTAENGVYQNLFGAFGVDGNKKSNYGMCRYNNPGNANHNKWDREYSTGSAYQFVGSCTLNEDYHVVFKTTSLTVNGEVFGSSLTENDFVETGYPTINIFRNEKITVGQYDQTMTGYFKSFALYTPKHIVRNYIPAVDAGGTVGLFDTVTGQFQSSAATALTAGTDQAAARYGWVRCVSKGFNASSTIPATARYIAAGINPLDFSDPANWACTNGYGIGLEDVIPTEETAITVDGETVFAVPANVSMPLCASIRFDDVVPADGADWRGLDLSKLTSDSVINLMGRTLRLAGEDGAVPSAFTITDSTSGTPGTLCFEVATNEIFANDTISLTGNLKLKKEGAGVFSAEKAGQTYSGGTDVSAGTVRVGSVGAGHFGTGIVLVSTNTTFDAYGNDVSYANLVLARGTLANTASANATLPAMITLTDDATLAFAAISSTHDMFIPAGTVWNLGGKTLSVILDGNDPDLRMNSGIHVISNGTFAVTVNTYNNVTKGWIHIQDVHGKDGLVLDLGNSILRLQPGSGNSTVLDYTANPPAGSDVTSNKRLEVYGTFTPQTAMGYSMTMMKDSTLNLAGWTGGYNCVFASKYVGTTDKNCFLDFATNATVTVNLAGREDLWTIARSESPYAITWSTKPDDSVTFVLDDATLALGFKAEVCEAGLKLCPPLGTMIFIR